MALDPDGRRVIGTLRLLVDGDRAKVGRVAVEREWRRRGIAARMLELALAGARERGCEQVRLAAQLAATGVYRRAGFAVESEPFEEAGIPACVDGAAALEPASGVIQADGRATMCGGERRHGRYVAP